MALHGALAGEPLTFHHRPRAVLFAVLTAHATFQKHTGRITTPGAGRQWGRSPLQAVGQAKLLKLLRIPALHPHEKS